MSALLLGLIAVETLDYFTSPRLTIIKAYPSQIDNLRVENPRGRVHRVRT